MSYYENRVVVVTGAGGVLCSVIAEGYARAGAKVALLDLSLEAAERAAAAISGKGFTARPYKCNVLELESLRECRERISAELGSCDILINGAGGNSPRANTDDEFYSEEDVGRIKTFFDLDRSGVEFVFHLNYMGTLLPTQVFAEDMVKKDDASILNISSMNAFCPLTKIPAYSGAKAAVSNFTKWLAVHFSKTAMRVNAIAPGFFVTAQNKSLLYSEDGTPSERSEKILRSTPMGRFGESGELVESCLFLTDKSRASFITGVILPIDGGFSAYSGV